MKRKSPLRRCNLRLVALALSTVAVFGSTTTWASHACSRVVLEVSHEYGRRHPEEKPEIRPYPEGLSPYNIRGKVQHYINELSLSGRSNLYACTTKKGENYCLSPLDANTWAVRGGWNANFRAKKEQDQVILENSTLHRTPPDWNGFGRFSWTNDYLIKFNTKNQSIFLLYKAGNDTTLGIKRRLRDSGSCLSIRPSSLGQDLEPVIRTHVMKNFVGTPGFIDQSSVANLFLASDKMYLATDASVATSEVELLDLSSETRQIVAVDSLANFRQYNTPDLAEALKGTKSVSQDFLTSGTKRVWSCLSDSNHLYESGGALSPVKHKGFTLIEMSAIQKAPGADLGYRPLAAGKILRSGYTGSFRPAMFSNKTTTATLFTDAQGRSLIINDIKTSNFESITGLPKAESQKAFGIRRDLITFGSWICFGD